jgi:hypothetical protein
VICWYKDTDGFPGTWETHVECPDQSSPLTIDKCVCWTDMVAVGGKCGPDDKAAQDGQVPPAPPVPEGAAPPAGRAPPPRAGNPQDPCLDHPATVDAQPDAARCPLSWRAWDIRRYLHVERHVSLRALQGSAVAVGKGWIKGGEVILIGTNDLRIWALMREPRMPLAAGEGFGSAPTSGEHAEDAVVRAFQARGVDRAKGVIIGSDPRGCDRCTGRYAAHAWVRHERPTLP